MCQDSIDTTARLDPGFLHTFASNICLNILQLPSVQAIAVKNMH